MRTGGHEFSAKVDTGAEISVMSKSVAKSLSVNRVRKCTSVITGYNGRTVSILALVESDISVSHGYRESACREESQTLLPMPVIKALGLIPAAETLSVVT